MTLPMYFTERPVTSSGTKYAPDMTLHFFGSVVGITVSNVGGNMTYSPHEVTFKTEAFTTEGKMNILAASEANSAKVLLRCCLRGRRRRRLLPSSALTSTMGISRSVRRTTLFFWVAPSTYTGTKTLKLDVRTDNYDKELGATSPEITKSFNVKPLFAASCTSHR